MISNGFVQSRIKQWKMELWGSSSVYDTNSSMKTALMKTIKMKDLCELKKSLPSPDYHHDISYELGIKDKDEIMERKVRTKQNTNIRHSSNDTWNEILKNHSIKNNK